MPPTSRRGKGGGAGRSQSGARKRRRLTPESRPTSSPTMITRSRAAEQSPSPQVGKRRASGSRATDKSRGDEKSPKKMKMPDAGSQEDAAAALASAATEEDSDASIQEDAGAASASAPTDAGAASASAPIEEGSDAAIQEDAGAASASAPTEQGSSAPSQEDAAAASSSAATQQSSSTASSPLRCPIMPEVIKSQDSNRVIYEPFDSAVVKAYMKADDKYMAKLERHKNLLTLNENWATTCLDRQERLPVQESARDMVFQAAEAVLGLSSYIDGKLLARCSGFLIDWDKKTQCGTVLTSANLLCTKSPRVDLWSCPREYDPNVEVLVHLLDDTTDVKGKLLNYHPHYNIALFEVVVNLSTELLVCTESVDYGQQVFLIGRDEKLHLKCNHGRVKCMGPGLHDHHHYMYVNCRVDKFGAGGPAINTGGIVMGMVNPTPTVAFIPTSIIFKCLHMWKTFKCVPRLHLGLKLSPVKFLLSTHRDRLRCRFKINDGVIVEEVSQGSAAEKVGIKIGDVIRSLNGESFSTTVELEGMLMRICEDNLGKGNDIGSNVDLAVELFQIRKERNCTKKLTLNVSEDVEVIAEGTYLVTA
ncbi:unnamed protein product [Urochloa humidicola]